jgi:hypothetical protein
VPASDHVRDIGFRVVTKYAGDVDRDARFPQETIDALKEAKLMSFSFGVAIMLS